MACRAPAREGHQPRARSCRVLQEALSKAGRVLLGTFFIVLWIIAGTKPGGDNGGGGDGGTNNVQMVNVPGGGLQPMNLSATVTSNQQQGFQDGIQPMQGGLVGDPAPVTDQWTDFTPITSTNTTRTLTGDDFCRGFVMTRIGTGETFGFGAPSNATVCADWEAFGAAEDWTYLALDNWTATLGTNEVNRFRVYSFGKAQPCVTNEVGSLATNRWYAPAMRLVTNVKLPDGKVHLELANATGQFTIWYYGQRIWDYRKLLDTASTPVKDLSMDYWKALMKRATNGESSEFPIYITSSTPGAVSLVFRYWNVIDGKFVQDQAVQRITSLRPPMRLDISRDGAIDDGDAAAWFDHRAFHYWVNEDKIYGDYIVPNRDYMTANSSDLVVNGTFDLINFFPVALDLEKFKAAWGNRVSYEIKPEWGNTNSFNFCLADIPWNVAGSVQTTNTTTLAGQPLSSASPQTSKATR